MLHQCWSTTTPTFPQSLTIFNSQTYLWIWTEFVLNLFFVIIFVVNLCIWTPTAFVPQLRLLDSTDFLCDFCLLFVSVAHQQTENTGVKIKQIMDIYLKKENCNTPRSVLQECKLKQHQNLHPDNNNKKCWVFTQTINRWVHVLTAHKSEF